MRVGVIFLFLALCAAIHPPGAAAGPPAAGMEALDFTLPYLTETTREWTLSDHYGAGREKKRAILLSFFGSWCAPCREELPVLDKLWRKYEAYGLVVVNVCVDAPPAAAAGDIIRKSGVSFPVLHDRLGIVKDRYGVTGLPRTYLVTGEGIIEKVMFGFPRTLEKEIRGVLQASPRGTP